MASSDEQFVESSMSNTSLDESPRTRPGQPRKDIIHKAEKRLKYTIPGVQRSITSLSDAVNEIKIKLKRQEEAQKRQEETQKRQEETQKRQEETLKEIQDELRMLKVSLLNNYHHEHLTIMAIHNRCVGSSERKC